MNTAQSPKLADALVNEHLFQKWTTFSTFPTNLTVVQKMDKGPAPHKPAQIFSAPNMRDIKKSQQRLQWTK